MQRRGGPQHHPKSGVATGSIEAKLRKYWPLGWVGCRRASWARFVVVVMVLVVVVLVLVVVERRGFGLDACACVVRNETRSRGGRRLSVLLLFSRSVFENTRDDVGFVSVRVRGRVDRID